ncbi:hypothetical protein ccbrp13_45070 [Ktedonobacteria bacterium brp13]|nr:hypothetical protein ccbrp13_45070 [Ktedonobacteria bacterium brp13]
MEKSIVREARKDDVRRCPVPALLPSYLLLATRLFIVAFIIIIHSFYHLGNFIPEGAGYVFDDGIAEATAL